MGYYTSYKDAAGQIFCDQTANVCLTFTDPGSRTICQPVKIADCSGGLCPDAVINNGLLLCTQDTSWNCNLCANDLPYFNPVSTTDELDFQFQQFDDLNSNGAITSYTFGWNTGACNVYLKDCCTDEYLEESPGVPKSIVDYCTQYYVSQFGQIQYNNIVDLKDIQAIRIPIANFYADFQAAFPGSDCFYFEFQFYFGGVTTNIYTEPYKFVNCENTLVIESDYPKLDCNNYWYGGVYLQVLGNKYIGNPFFYSNKIRIPAYIERTSFEITKEFLGLKLTTKTSQMTENFQLLTERVPERIALLLANILTGEKVYIGNGEFVVSGSVSKNNEIGNQWFIESELKRINCALTFSCNN